MGYNAPAKSHQYSRNSWVEKAPGSKHTTRVLNEPEQDRCETLIVGELEGDRNFLVRDEDGDVRMGIVE